MSAAVRASVECPDDFGVRLSTVARLKESAISPPKIFLMRIGAHDADRTLETGRRAVYCVAR